MNSRQRRKAYRKSPYKVGTTWTFRGARMTITRVVSLTEVHVEWEDGAHSYVSTQVLGPTR